MLGRPVLTPEQEMKFGVGNYDATRGCGGQCHLSTACPYPICLGDYPGGARMYEVDRRRWTVMRDYFRLDIEIQDLAKKYKVSTRTIHRIIKGGLERFNV